MTEKITEHAAKLREFVDEVRKHFHSVQTECQDAKEMKLLHKKL